MVALENTPLSALFASLALAIVCVPAAQPASAQETVQDEEQDDVLPEVVELYEEVAHIPFTIGGRRPIPTVEALVEGEGPFQFLFDTGASVCVLDSGFVAELGIPILGSTEIGDHTANARIPADLVQLSTLELEGIRYEELPAVAFDRSRFGGGNVRGVLGLPLFREHLLTVDYGKGRLEVSDRKLPETGRGIIPFEVDSLPVITMTIGGKKFPLHVDSGSPGAFTLPASMVEGMPHKSVPKVVGRARTVNSEFEVWSVQLDGTIVVAGNEFVDPIVSYNEILPTGLIGYQVLKDFELTIDQRSKRLRLVPPAEASGASTGGD